MHAFLNRQDSLNKRVPSPAVLPRLSGYQQSSEGRLVPWT